MIAEELRWLQCLQNGGETSEQTDLCEMFLVLIHI